MTQDAWGGMAYAVFIIALLALFVSDGMSTRTARNDVNPPATTGQVR